MALILGGDAPFVSESGEQQNLAALRRAAYDLEHSALETLRAVAVVLYEKRLASGRAPADFRLRDDHACVAMTLTRRKNGRKCLRASASSASAASGARRTAPTARPGSAARSSPSPRAPGGRGRRGGARHGASASASASARRPTPTPAQAAWFGAVVDEVDHLLYRYRRWRRREAIQPPRAAAPARALATTRRRRRRDDAARSGARALRRGDVCAVSRRRLEGAVVRVAGSRCRPELMGDYVRCAAAPGGADDRLARQVRKKAPGPLKGFDAPSEANGERCCVYFDAAKKRWCLGPRARRSSSPTRRRPLRRRAAWHAFSADKGDAGGGFELESSWSDRVAGCDDVAAVWVGATHKTYVPRAALAPLPHGEALAFLVESDGAAARRAPAGGKPAAPRATPKKSAAAEVLATVGAAAAFGAAAKPKKAPAARDASTREWTYKTDQERRVEREDGVLCDEEPMDVARWTALAKALLGERGGGAFSHVFDCDTLDAGGKAGWRSRVAPELLGVQFDGANFTVVHLPDEGVTDPHAVVSHDPRLEDHVWDLRRGAVPETLRVVTRPARADAMADGDDDDEPEPVAVDAAPLLRMQKDRSSCLVLPPKHWLELAPTDVPANNGWPQARQGGGACHFLPPAAPGASGGRGVARRRGVDASRAATLRARRWNRVVIAVEAQWEKGRKVKVYVNGAPSFEGYWNRDGARTDKDNVPLAKKQKRGKAKKDRLRGLATGSRREDWRREAPAADPGAREAVRVLDQVGLYDDDEWTDDEDDGARQAQARAAWFSSVEDVPWYRSATSSRGLSDAELALSGFSLFCSDDDALCLPQAVAVRRVALHRGALSREAVGAILRDARIFSYLDKADDAAEAAALAKRSLAPLLLRPPPAWRHPALLAAFGDVTLAGVAQGGPSLVAALGVLRLAAARAGGAADARAAAGAAARATPRALVDALGAAGRDALGRLAATLAESLEIAKRCSIVADGRNLATLSRAVKPLVRTLAALPIGASVLVPLRLPMSDGRHHVLVFERGAAAAARAALARAREAPPEAEATYTVAVVCAHAHLLGFHESTLCATATACKERFRTAKSFGGVPAARATCPVFWAAALSASRVPQPSSEVYKDKTGKKPDPDEEKKRRGVALGALYDWLLPWLAGRPFGRGPPAGATVDDFRTPQRSGAHDYRTVLHSLAFVARRSGLGPADSKQLMLALKMQLLAFAEHDLSFLESIEDADVKLLDNHGAGVAHSAAKLATRPDRSGSMGPDELEAVWSAVRRLDDKVRSLPRSGREDAGPEPLLLDASHRARRQVAPYHGLDRLLRRGSVDKFAARPCRRRYAPVDFLARARVDARRGARRHALGGPRLHADLRPIRPGQALGLPEARLRTPSRWCCPRRGALADRARPCLWADEDILYGQQLDGLILLQRLVEHFAAAAFSINSRADGSRTVVPAVAAAVADALARRAALDEPSYLSLTLSGAAGRSLGFGISAGPLALQSATIEARDPHLSVARTSVLDYFAAQAGLEKTMCWDMGQSRAAANLDGMLRSLCDELAWNPSPSILPYYATAPNLLLAKNCPEWACYRDVAFYFKYFMNTSAAAFPAAHASDDAYTQRMAHLSWSYDEAQHRFVVAAFSKSLACASSSAARFPSNAAPGPYCAPHAATEDDVLHVKQLPSFGDALGQHDSELLLSYLTVPYIRLPLVLRFFSTEDRVHALRTARQGILDAVLFEPGRYLEAGLGDRAPRSAPCGDDETLLLATPYGHLLNELQRSPKTTCDAVVALLKHALDLDAGTVRATTVPIIQYLARTCARVDAYLDFVLAYDADADPLNPLRDFALPAAHRSVIEAASKELRRLLRGPVHCMVEAWISELAAECADGGDKTLVDANARLIANLEAHNLVVFRTATSAADMTEDVASTVACAMTYLQTRHSWNRVASACGDGGLRRVPDLRRPLLERLTSTTGKERADVCEAILRVTAGSGQRLVAGGATTRAAQVGAVAEPKHLRPGYVSARFTLSPTPGAPGDEPIEYVDRRDDRAARATRTASGRRRTRPLAPHPPGLLREYAPDALEKDEYWLLPLVEPLRLAYFNDPRDPVHLWMAEDPLDASATVARLVANRPEAGGCWREIYAFRDHAVVHVYDVFSHARRFHRALVHTTDTRFTLKEMQPELPPPCGAGDPFESLGPNEATSVAVMRDHDHAGNLSLTRETYVPTRLLAGQLPEALLDAYEWWQDEGDDLALVELPPIESRAAGADHGERTPYAMAVAAIAKLVERHAPERRRRRRALAPSRAETVGSLCAAVDAALPAGSGGDVAEHRLLNLLLAKEGSELHSVARTLSRVDNLSSILAWTAATTRDEPDAEPTYAISVVELPRLKLSFAERGGKLYSLDHAQLAISNVSNAMTKSLIRGLPHSLLLANANDELTVLLPSVRVTRPALGVFSTALVVDRTNAPVGAGRRAWGAALKDGFYYLYDAHVSLGYLICPTLAASLYLLLLRFLSRDYARCFQLARAVGVDYELSEECANILAAFAAGNDDDHPDAISCRLRVTIVLADAGATVPWDVASHSLVDFHTGAKLVEKLSRVSASCRLSREEELRLLKRFAVVDASKHSVAERTAIRKRREHLAARAGRASPTFAASLSPKYVHGGDWVARVASNTRPVLQARPEFAAGVQLRERDADPTIYGVQAVDELFALLQAKANGSPEDVLGSTHGRGFLYLYSLLAGGASVDVFGGGSASWSTAAATSTRSSYSRGATSWDLDFDDYDADLDAWDDRRWRRPTRAPATPAGRSWAGLAMFALENVAGPSPVASILATLASYPELVPGLPEWRKPSAGGAKTKGRGRAVGDSTKRVFSGRDPSVAALFDEILEVSLVDPATASTGRATTTASRRATSALTTIAEHIPHCRCGPDVGWARPDVSDHAASPSTRLRAVAPFVAKIAAELEASERREAANAALLERRKVLSAAHVRKALDDAPLFRKARRMDVDGATPTDFRWFDDEALDAAAADHLEAVAAGGRFRDGSVVAVFAGAAWDPSRLAAALKTLHEKLRREGGDGSFEIIFASLDQSEAEMAEFFVADHGDWLCLKYGDKAAADRLFGLWKPGGAPALLLLDATDGSVLCEDGFAALRKDPTAEKLPADDGSRLVRARLVAAKAQFERLSLAKENLLHEIEARASTPRTRSGGARAEATVDEEFLYSCLLSSEGAADVRRINPFLGDATRVLDLATALMLHAARRREQRLTAAGAAGAAPGRRVRRRERRGPPARAPRAPPQVRGARGPAVRAAPLTRTAAGRTTSFLLTEFAWNIVLREKQVALVRDIAAAVGDASRVSAVVKQMLMGGGKTTVVAPLLALLLGADARALVALVVPPALLEFSRANLRATFNAVIHKPVYTLEIDRNTTVTAETIAKLDHCRKSRGVVIATPSTVKAAHLKYVECCELLTDALARRGAGSPLAGPANAVDLAAVEAHASELRRLLGLFKGGVAIVDEVDLVLHPLKSELNFPIGDKVPLDFSPERWQLAIHMLDAVFSYETGASSVGFDESVLARKVLGDLRRAIDDGFRRRALQRSPHLTLLSLSYYHDTLKPILAEWAVFWLMKSHVGGVTREDTLRFLVEGASEAGPNADVARRINDRSTIDAAHAQMLTLARDWIQSFLPHCLSKIDRVSFGVLDATDLQRAREDPRMPLSRRVLAIPSGMPYSAVEARRVALLASFEKELGPFRRRKSSLLFEHWISAAGGALKTSDTASSMICETGDDVRRAVERLVNDEECVPLRLLRRSNSGQMNKIYKLLRRSPHCVHHFLESFVFPEHMRHQSTKLSASGQEIGGDVLFPRRVGFSGTPSDLIPAELGRCGYELGSDGYMIECLTRADVSAHVNVADDWTVDSLLRDVARSEAPRLNALIDVGALVTGTDKKMILVRATKRVVALETSGIPPHRRFAFYDNIHTTGMDIHHSATAVAAVTLGKDSNFRDYAQGAFRMRGVAKGQRLVTLLIPELRDLVRRDLALARIPCPPQLGGDAPGEAGDLSPVGVAVVAWLTLQSMKGERLQFNQLSVQNALNVPRKNAFAALFGAALASGSGQRLTLSAPSVTGSTRRATADAATEATITRTKGFVVTAIRVDHDAPFGGGRGFVQIYDRHPPRRAAASNPTFAADAAAVGVYLEPLDFAVADRVAPPAPLAETLARSVEDHAKFVASPEDRDRCARWVDALRSMPVKAEECELAREMVQEMEEEREKQQEQEQERAVEVEKYVDCAYRRDGEAVELALDRLRHRDLCRQFYPLSDFRLFARRPLEFPAFVLSSDNYFRRDWIGERRLKNVVATAEDDAWRALAMGGALAADGFEALATSGRLEPYEDGRFVVAVSLAEAETLRRVLHVRQGRALLDGSRCALALSLNDDTVLDASTDFAPAAAPFSRDASRACLSFFDSNAYHGGDSTSRAVLGWRNAPSARRRWFTQVAACRRRFSRPWREQPVAAVFQLSDAGSMTLLRCLSAGLRRALERAGVHLFDAFHEAWDASGNGILSPKEVVAALRACGLGGAASLDDVLDFVDRADGDGDGNLSYYELVDALRDPEEAPDDDGDDDRDDAALADKALAPRRRRGATRPSTPRGARARRRLDAEAAERDADAREEERVRLAVERAEDEQDARFGRRSNPSVDASKPGGEATFSFATGRHVRGARVRGTTAFLERAGAIELAASARASSRRGPALQVMRVLRATPGLCGPEEDLTYLVPSVDRLLDAAAQANSEAQLWTQVECRQQLALRRKTKDAAAGASAAAPSDPKEYDFATSLAASSASTAGAEDRAASAESFSRRQGSPRRDVHAAEREGDAGRRRALREGAGVNAARRVVLTCYGNAKVVKVAWLPGRDRTDVVDLGCAAAQFVVEAREGGLHEFKAGKAADAVAKAGGGATFVFDPPRAATATPAARPTRGPTPRAPVPTHLGSFSDGRLVEIAHAASRTVVIVSETFGRVTARDGEWAYVDAGAVAKLARQIRRALRRRRGRGVEGAPALGAEPAGRRRRPRRPAGRREAPERAQDGDAAARAQRQRRGPRGRAALRRADARASTSSSPVGRRRAATRSGPRSGSRSPRSSCPRTSRTSSPAVGEIHAAGAATRGGLPAATATVAVAGEVVATAEIPGARPRSASGGLPFRDANAMDESGGGARRRRRPRSPGRPRRRRRTPSPAASAAPSRACSARARPTRPRRLVEVRRARRRGDRDLFAPLSAAPAGRLSLVSDARDAAKSAQERGVSFIASPCDGRAAGFATAGPHGLGYYLEHERAADAARAREVLTEYCGTRAHVDAAIYVSNPLRGLAPAAPEPAAPEPAGPPRFEFALNGEPSAKCVVAVARTATLGDLKAKLELATGVPRHYRQAAGPGGGAAAPSPPTETIRGLKLKLSELGVGIAPERQRLAFAGKACADSATLRGLDIFQNCVLAVEESETGNGGGRSLNQWTACVRVRVGPRSEKGKATSRPLLGAAPPGARADDAPPLLAVDDSGVAGRSASSPADSVRGAKVQDAITDKGDFTHVHLADGDTCWGWTEVWLVVDAGPHDEAHATTYAATDPALGALARRAFDGAQLARRAFAAHADGKKFETLARARERRQVDDPLPAHRGDGVGLARRVKGDAADASKKRKA
ncbi:hypothetical protein JL720_16406 [Aureococcus anophagefferens]|nr:hypothetical protein JL720_16406 [Aureococcus anophagefferens]